MRQRGKTYIVLMGITVGCKIMGFLRESILAFFFGANNAVDAYKLSESLSSVLLGWMVAFSVAFVPIYSEIKAGYGTIKAKKYTHKIIAFVGVVALLSVVIAFFASNTIISLGAPGFSAEKKAITEDMYRICILAYLVFAQVSILNNYLNCNDKYFSAGASTLLISITQIIFIVAAYYVKDPLVMAYGLPASMFARYVFLRIRSKIGPVDVIRESRLIPLSEEVRNTARTAFPLFLSEIVISANELIDNTFASGLPEGSVSVLSYANILSASFHTLITSSILTVFYTTISKNVAEKDKGSELKELNYTFILLSTILIPFVMFAMIFSKWGINLVYERGAFVPETTVKTAISFAVYILGIPAITFRNMAIQYYQAYKKTKVPLILSAINIVINIILNFLLVNRLGYIGLALATTLSYYVLFPIEIILIKRLCKEFHFHQKLMHCFKLLLASLIPALIACLAIYNLDSFYYAQNFVFRIFIFCATLCLTIAIFGFIAIKMRLIDVNKIKTKFSRTAGNGK